MKDADIERMIGTFEAKIAPRPDYALRLADLAALVANRKAALRAFALARKAQRLAPDDPQVQMKAGTVLASLVPGYHVPMMNDARRNKAWDEALRRAIRPGMLVFEIGTGAGMLALMAARAGAEKVYTCESHPVIAQMACELAAANGYGDRIEVIVGPSVEVHVGSHLPRRADLLICDIFGDSLVDFDPLSALADARKRLVVEGAPNVPARGALRVALAARANYPVHDHIDTACGFDLRIFAPFALRASHLKIGDPALTLRSEAATILSFDFGASSHRTAGQGDVVLTAGEDCDVNGVARWIRLDLDAQTCLEARPEPGAEFFSAPVFIPFAEPMRLRAGERLRIAARYQDKAADTWLVGRV